MNHWVYDDGGRADAGYKGRTGDCATRSLAIVTGMPHQTVYDAINDIAATERLRKREARKSNARTGVWPHTIDKFFQLYLPENFEWVATMGIGTGCRVHLHPAELPAGRLMARCSKHFTAVIDGIIHDIHDPSRHGTRCVYGYWRLVEGGDAP